MNPAVLRLMPTVVRWVGGSLVAWFASEAVASHSEATAAAANPLPNYPTPPTDIGGPDWEMYLDAMSRYNDALRARTAAAAEESAKYGAIVGVACIAAFTVVLAKRR